MVRAFDAAANRFHVMLSMEDSSAASGPKSSRATPQKVFAFKKVHLRLLDAEPTSTSGHRPTLETLQTPLRRIKSPSSSSLVGSASRLPQGWESHLDPVSGHEYYYNSASGVTTWVRPTMPEPEDQMGFVESDDKKNGTSHSKFILRGDEGAEMSIDAEKLVEAPEAWAIVSEFTKLEDAAEEGEEEETFYYLHKASGETSWQPPRLGVSDEDHAANHRLLERWARQWDSVSGAHYWSHLASGHTQWHAPGGGADQLSAQASKGKRESLVLGSAATKGDDRLGGRRVADADEGGEWQRHFDEQHHSAYYAHKVTGETSWEAPSDVNCDDEIHRNSETSHQQVLLNGHQRQVAVLVDYEAHTPHEITIVQGSIVEVRSNNLRLIFLQLPPKYCQYLRGRVLNSLIDRSFCPVSSRFLN